MDKNIEGCSYYACFNLRNVLLWFCIYPYKEKKCQGSSAWVSCRAFCYNGLLSVIVLVTKTHFGLHGEFTKEWMNEPLDESKKWSVPLMTLMKRWPYWRFHQTVKKTENTPQHKLNMLCSDIVFIKLLISWLLKKSLTFCPRKFKMCEI